MLLVGFALLAKKLGKIIGLILLVLLGLNYGLRELTAQGTTYSAGQIITVSTAALPGTCTVGAIYIRTATSIAVSFCSATDTWLSIWPYSSGSNTTNVGGGLTVSGVQTCTTSSCSLSLSTPIVYCDASSNSVTLNLPDSFAGAAFYSIQRIDNTAGNTCTLDGDSSDTINNQTTYLVQPDVSYSLIGKDTSKWRIISSFLPSVPAEVNLGTVGSTETIDLAGNYRGQWRMVLDENLTITLTNPVYGGSYVFIFTQDGSGTNTVTWPNTVEWPDSTTPTITATADRSSLCVLTYTNADAGNQYMGECSLNFNLH